MPIIQALTHLDLYWVVLVEVDRRDSRDIEGACFIGETEKQQEPWPPNLLGRETVVGMGERDVNFPAGQIKWEPSNLLALASVTSVLRSLRSL